MRTPSGDSGARDRRAHFPVTTCTTCGQHYYRRVPRGLRVHRRGRVGSDGSWWEPLEETSGGYRVVLFDRLIGSGDDDDEDASPRHPRTAPLHFCRHCGAAHPVAVSRFLSCGAPGAAVLLRAVRQSASNQRPGMLASCLSCGATGHRSGAHYREPARAVRAINVSDVHVLTQDMVHHAERPRRLVFCDNRQDAAFQAGWMKDHARRFRLRALMAEGIRPRPCTVGDLVAWLDGRLKADETLFSLPRSPATALREYVPGNLIYANGHRFVARRFHRDVVEEHAEMPWYEVSTERQAVTASRHGEALCSAGTSFRPWRSATPT